MSNTEQDLSASEVEFAIKLAEDPVFFMENILRNPEDPDKNFAFKEGNPLQIYTRLLGVMIRDEYMKRKNISISEIDKHDPAKN